MYALEHHFIRTNGIVLHTVMAGPVDGPVVILLHGFPEFWYGWRQQIPALAAAGFRVWAPDQRGYNLSDKPKGRAAYRVDLIARDAIGLIEATGHSQVCLAGHDWGAMVAWWVALTAPERVRHLAILNVPHPEVSTDHIRTDPRQMVRSTYAIFFQLPWLPEALLRAGDYRLLGQMIKGSARRGAFSDEEINQYRRAWSQPGALSAMLNWYRAYLLRPIPGGSPRVTVPTTVIWGKKDIALRSVMAEESAALCDRGELLWLPENSHWVQHEAADRVNEILITRFSG
jgi:pimeloyl-ACP methyl ester carboxylesterase